jgi:hypothetical protein
MTRTVVRGRMKRAWTWGEHAMVCPPSRRPRRSWPPVGAPRSPLWRRDVAKAQRRPTIHRDSLAALDVRAAVQLIIPDKLTRGGFRGAAMDHHPTAFSTTGAEALHVPVVEGTGWSMCVERYRCRPADTGGRKTHCSSALSERR